MGVELFDGMRLRIQSTLLEDAGGDTEQKMELEQRLKGIMLALGLGLCWGVKLRRCRRRHVVSLEF